MLCKYLITNHIIFVRNDKGRRKSIGVDLCENERRSLISKTFVLPFEWSSGGVYLLSRWSEGNEMR